MSANLYWEPIRPHKGKSLGDGLKFILRDHHHLNDGDITLDESDVKWLKGILAGTRDEQLKQDVETLIEAIEKYESVRVWQEF